MTGPQSILTPPDLLGYAGVGLVVVTYGLSQLGRMDVKRPLYPALNGVGALLILVSLYFRPNPPSVVIEFFWLAISLVGLIRALTSRRA
ncbi:MAG: CBU_0592 family membrane protein [Parvularculaceae bacterium]